MSAAWIRVGSCAIPPKLESVPRLRQSRGSARAFTMIRRESSGTKRLS
jgi:hypothetical protein